MQIGWITNKQMVLTMPARCSFQHTCQLLSFGYGVNAFLPHHGAGGAREGNRRLNPFPMEKTLKWLTKQNMASFLHLPKGWLSSCIHLLLGSALTY